MIPAIIQIAKLLLNVGIVVSVLATVRDLIGNRFGNVEDRLATSLQQDEGIDKDDAEKAIAALSVSMLVGAGLTQKEAIKTYLTKGGKRKDIEQIVKGFKPISVKNRNKLIAEMKKAGKLNVRAIGKRTFVPAVGGGAMKLVMGAILLMMFTQQVGDWLVFFPESLKRIFGWLGLDVDIPVAPPKVLGEDKPAPALAILEDSLRAEGAVGLIHPGTEQVLVLSVDNLAIVLEALEQQVAKEGLPTFPNNVLPRLDKYVKKTSVALARADGKPVIPGVSLTDQIKRRIIVRMVEESKPKAFFGTLFSFPLKQFKPFERTVTDEINNDFELVEDVKLNINAWLQTLPGRLKTTVAIVRDPVDANGVKQSGSWAVAKMIISHVSGKITPLDQILLGPINPQTYMPKPNVLRSIETQVPEFFTTEEIAEVQIPGGQVNFVDKEGNVVPLSFDKPIQSNAITTPTQPTQPKTPAVAPTVPTPKPTPAPVEKKISTVPQQVQEEIQFDPNEFESGRRGAFITQLGVFKGQIVRVATGGANLNSRTFGSLSAPINRKFPDQTLLVIDGWEGTNDGFTWARVRSKETNINGIVASEFLESL